MNGIQKIIKVIAIGLAIILIVNIFSWCFYGLSWITDIDFSGNKEEKITFEAVYQNIENIEIDAVFSNISIQTGTELKVEVQNIEKRLFTAEVKNRTLRLEEESSWFSKTVGQILITIPNNILLEELKIDTGSGKFKIEGIQVQKFEMNHGAGLLEIKNVTFDKTDIDGGAGEIKILSSKLQNLELDAGVGRVEIEADITGRSKIECGVGELELTLLGTKQDYSIQTEKGLGEIEIEGQKQSNHTTYGTGSRIIELEGGVGSIQVQFQN